MHPVDGIEVVLYLSVLWLHDIIRAWFEELKKKRVAELKRDLELSEELIGLVTWPYFCLRFCKTAK